METPEVNLWPSAEHALHWKWRELALFGGTKPDKL